MLDRILGVLGDAHFEAYIGGPIAGFILSLIFAWANSASGSGGATQGPRDIYIQINNQYSNAAPGRRSNATTSGDGDPSAFVGLTLLFMVAGFLFVAYLPQISTALYFCITSVCTFTLSSCIIIWFKGSFSSAEWLRYTVIPSLLSAGSFYVTYRAEQAIISEVINYAHGLLGNGKITFALIVNGAFTFYRNIGDAYAKWILFQMAAFILVTLTTIIAFLGWLYFISLANIQSGGERFWIRLAIGTHRYSTAGSTLFATTFLFFAWFCASGEAYTFFIGQT